MNFGAISKATLGKPRWGEVGGGGGGEEGRSTNGFSKCIDTILNRIELYCYRGNVTLLGVLLH